MAHQSEWVAEKESLVNYAAAELSTGRQEWHGKDHTGKDVVFFQKISDAGIHPEGYVLEVKPEIVTVSASTATGLFYGLQSLLQLMKPDERGGWTVPAVTVKDSPRFGYRGVHDRCFASFPPEGVCQEADRRYGPL